MASEEFQSVREKWPCGQSYHFTLGVLRLPSGQPAVHPILNADLKNLSSKLLWNLYYSLNPKNF